MAKISAEFDTQTKELTITMDGKTIDNVQSVCLSKAGSYYEDNSDKKEFGMSIMTLSKNKDEKYDNYNQIVASESKEGKEAVAAGLGAAYAGYGDIIIVPVKGKDAKEKIADYLRRYMKR